MMKNEKFLDDFFPSNKNLLLSMYYLLPKDIFTCY